MACPGGGGYAPSEPSRPARDVGRHEVDAARPAASCRGDFGVVEITYGFAGPELVKAIRKRAAEGGCLPNTHPPGDQHAGHESNTRGTRICKVNGFAVDLRVPGVPSDVVSDWVRANLPFDAIYLYGPERPFHLSWSPMRRGTVIRMLPKKSAAGLHPVTVTRRREDGVGRQAR